MNVVAAPVSGADKPLAIGLLALAAALPEKHFPERGSLVLAAARQLSECLRNLSGRISSPELHGPPPPLLPRRARQ
ncbi:MAG: hypothetical protein ACYDAG_06315 [Chloroflexota bacterium]